MVLSGKVNLIKQLFSRHPHAEAAAVSRTFDWPGQSGNDYQYEVHSLDAEFRPLPGNYIYVQRTAEGGWVPIYVAQTRDLHQRLEGSVRKEDAIAQGATHLHAHYNASGQAARCEEERDLIKRWQPVCNEVLES